MTRAAALQPRRTPVQRRSTATVEAIVEAAAQVFERHGYASGTTNRIAERAGVSIGTLYQYFPNKDAILIALTERHLDEGIALLGPLLRDLVEHPPPVRVGVRRLLDGLLELHRHQPALHRVLFEEAPRPPALRRRLDAVTERATGAVARYLAARPEVTVPDPAVAAALVVAVLEATTHGLAIHPRAGLETDAHVRAAATMLERYLTG